MPKRKGHAPQSPADAAVEVGWLSKTAAAQRLGRSVKTLERYLRERPTVEIRKKYVEREGRRPEALFSQEDVEALAQATQVEHVLPPIRRQPVMDVVQTSEQLTQLMGRLLPAIAGRMVPAIEKAQVEVRISEKVFLTLKEARVFTGLPFWRLRELRDGGTAGAWLGKRWKFRRKDLEGL